MKTKTKLLISVFCACTALVAAGCGKASPGEVALKVYEGVRDGNAKVIQANCTESTAALFTMLGPMAAEELKGAKFQVLETKIDGDKATVKIETTERDGGKKTEDFSLVKVKGEWKADVEK